jgi:hypothetical protein
LLNILLMFNTVVIVLAISTFCNWRKFLNKAKKDVIDPN